MRYFVGNTACLASIAKKIIVIIEILPKIPQLFHRVFKISIAGSATEILTKPM
jgi:hypothetical protein